MLRPTKLELEDPFSQNLDDELGVNIPQKGPEDLPLDIAEEPTMDAWDYAKDWALAPLRGVTEAARATVGFVDTVGESVTGGDFIDDKFHTRGRGLYMERSKTTVGTVIEGVSEFVVGFVPFVGVLGKIGKAQKLVNLANLGSKSKTAVSIAKGATAGALTDLVAFQGLEGRLSDMIEADGRLSNPISEFLASDPDDTEMEGRLKNALEGLMLGGAIDGIVIGVKALRAGRNAKGKGGSPTEINEAVAEVVSEDTSLGKAADEIELNNKQTIEELPENQKASELSDEELEFQAELDDELGQASVAKEFTSDLEPTDVELEARKYKTAEEYVAAQDVDTIGQGQQFHGTSKKIESLGEGQGSADGIYGTGFYTTDSASTAKGYTTTGLGKDKTLYKITEQNPSNLYDLDAPLTPELRAELKGSFGAASSIMKESKTLREAYDTFRDESADLELSSVDVQEFFDRIQVMLQDKGFNGFTHVGGKNTKGAKPHKVNIYFEPSKDLSIEQSGGKTKTKQELTDEWTEATTPKPVEIPQAKAIDTPQPKVKSDPASNTDVPAEVRNASDSTTDKFTDATRRIELKAMARNPDISNVANFNSSAFSGPKDIQMYLEFRAAEMVKQDLAKGKKVSPPVETLKQTADKSIQTLEDIMGEGLSFELQMKMHKMNAKQLHSFTHQLGALEVQITNTSKTILEESRLFTTSNAQIHKVNAKRAIQQLAVMQQMAGGYKYAQGHALQANRFNKHMRQYSKTDAKIMTEMLDSGDDAIFDKLLHDISLAKDGAPMGKMINDRLKNGKWVRVHNEFWLNSILSGLKTHVVQLASNSANTMFLPAEGWAGAMIKGDREGAEAMAKQYTFMMESVASSFHFAKKAWKKGEGILDSNDSFEGTNTRNISADSLNLDIDSTLGKLAEISGNIVRGPTRMLMSTDEFFKQLNYRSAAKSKFYEIGAKDGLSGVELDTFINDRFKKVIDKSGKMHSEKNVQAAGEALGRNQGLQGVDLGHFVSKHVKENFEPTNSELKNLADASEYASMVASEATFTTKLNRDGNVLEQASVALQQFGNKQPIMKLLVPFVTTPVNLVKFVGQRTLPMGKTPVLSELHQRYTKDLASSDALVVAKAKGRVASGAMMWTTSAGLGLSGLITGGGPDDHTERKTLEASGWQPWSLKVGDTYISYNRTEPFGTFLGLVGGFSERMRRGLPHEDEGLNHVAMSAILAFSDNITDRTYMSGLSDVLAAISDPAKGGAALGRNRAASYIPSLLNGSKPLAGDTAMREVRDLQDALINRTPFLSKGLDPRRNILGEVIEAKMFIEPMNSMGNPLTMSRDKGDVVFTELAELHHGFGNPSPILGGTVDLTDYENPNTGYTAYDRYLELTGEVKLGGKTLHQSLKKLVKSAKYRKLISTKDFEDLDDVGANPRVREISRIISRYRSEARKRLSREFPDIKSAVKNTGLAKEALKSGSSMDRVQAFLDAT